MKRPNDNNHDRGNKSLDAGALTSVTGGGKTRSLNTGGKRPDSEVQTGR